MPTTRAAFWTQEVEPCVRGTIRPREPELLYGKNVSGELANHLGVDRAHKLIRKWDATHAAVHDSQKLEDLLDLSNTGNGGVDVIAELQQQWRRDLEQVQQRFLDMLVRAALPGEIAEQRIFSLNARLNITEAKIERRLTFTSVVRRLLLPISTSGMPDSVRSTSSGHRDSLAHGSFRPDCVCRAGASPLAL